MLKHNARSSKKSGAQFTSSKPTIKTQFQSYFDVHAQTLFSSLGHLTRKPTAFLMTLLVLSISLALSSSFYLIIKNFQQLTGTVESSNQISVFLKLDVAPNVVSKLREKISLDPQVSAVQLITPDQAMAEFKANSEFGDALDAFQKNPLPTVLVVTPKIALDDETSMTELLGRLDKIPELEVVKSDLQWVQRLRGIFNVANRAVFLLSILFGMAVLLIIGNTIRLELQDRRQEVMVTKLVGGTNAFIRRPFLYTGFWLGFLSSVAAWFIVTVFLLILRSPVQSLSAQYAGQFNLVFLNYTETLGLIGFASFLGVLGAWLVLSNQLQALEIETN